MKHLVVLFVAALWVTTAPAATAPMNPGLWQITLETMGQLPPPPAVGTRCVTANEPLPALPQLPPDADCRVSGTGFDSGQNVLDYAVTCPKAKVTSNAHFTYSGDSFEGTVTIAPQGGEAIVQKITGVRVGACSGQ